MGKLMLMIVQEKKYTFPDGTRLRFLDKING